MKRILALALFALGLGAGAAAFAAYTKQTTRVDRVQLNVSRDNAGTVTAVQLTGFIQTKLLVNDADASDQVPAPWKPVSFDLLTVPNTTAATKTCNGIQVAAILQQMVLDQATAQGVQ